MIKIQPALYSILLLITILSPSLAANLYRWTDDRGVVHFTDNVFNIPPQFRDNVTLIKAIDPPPGQQPQTPISLDRTTVPFQKNGQVVVVDGTLNNRVSTKFVVDTGASYTMISPATARQLNINLEEKHPTVPFQTANGKIEAPLVNLESVDIGGMHITDLTAAVHDIFPDSTTTGLLGLNFLSHFKLDIDTENGILVLERK
jgi:clan AA aspartic protease (TIGR02281 family)